LPVRIEFDWDPVKATTNFTKHDVAFEDAMTVFADPLALSRLEGARRTEEERWVTIGMSGNADLLLVVHTHVEFAEDHIYIRIISARRPTKKERRDYEQSPG
jgi:uncharacterized protein